MIETTGIPFEDSPDDDQGLRDRGVANLAKPLAIGACVLLAGLATWLVIARAAGDSIDIQVPLRGPSAVDVPAGTPVFSGTTPVGRVIACDDHAGARFATLRIERQSAAAVSPSSDFAIVPGDEALGARTCIRVGPSRSLDDQVSTSRARRADGPDAIQSLSPPRDLVVLVGMLVAIAVLLFLIFRFVKLLLVLGLLVLGLLALLA